MTEIKKISTTVKGDLFFILLILKLFSGISRWGVTFKGFLILREIKKKRSKQTNANRELNFTGFYFSLKIYLTYLPLFKVTNTLLVIFKILNGHDYKV